MDKDKINKEVVEIANNVLKKYNQPYRVDKLAILNSSDGVTFLGNLRVHDENQVKNILKDLEYDLKNYGKLTIKNRHVVPCCELPYNHISFNLLF
jgi:hypothetical protein